VHLYYQFATCFFSSTNHSPEVYWILRRETARLEIMQLAASFFCFMGAASFTPAFNACTVQTTMLDLLTVRPKFTLCACLTVLQATMCIARRCTALLQPRSLPWERQTNGPDRRTDTILICLPHTRSAQKKPNAARKGVNVDVRN